MEVTLLRVWLVAMWIGILFFVFRVAIPALINMHNDGALIAAPVLALAVGTAAYATYRKVFMEDDNAK